MSDTNTSEENWNLCKGCTMCCEYITIIIDTPKTPEQIDRIRWYLLHKNIYVFVTAAAEWRVFVPTKCTALDDKGMCSIYEDRPMLCRAFEQKSCERYDKTPFADFMFTSVKEFDAYLAARA